MPESSSRFSIVDVTVILIVVLLIIGGVFVVLSSRTSRGHSHSRFQNLAQLRGIHLSMFTYAQSNGGYYVGFDTTGAIVNATVEYRFQVQLDGNFFTGEYIIAPMETKTEWTTGPLTSANYSYTMLDIDAGGGRAEEWTEASLNSNAIVLADRNIGIDTKTNVKSLHHNSSPGNWRGSVICNDNHMTITTPHELETQYGSAPTNKLDNLFEAAGTDDAMMLYSGN